MKEQLIQWVKGEKGHCEQIILNACEYFLRKNRHWPNFYFDLQENEREALGLSRGKDMYYDRPTVGLTYSQFYLARRINTSLSYLPDLIVEASSNKQPLNLLDLGSGTGAVQFTLNLCLAGLKAMDAWIPPVHIVNLDISPFMLQFNRDYLWPLTSSRFGKPKGFTTEYHLNSWTNAQFSQAAGNPILIASYLFDFTEDNVKEAFAGIARKFDPKSIVILSSGQPAKRQFTDKVAEEFEKHGYACTPLAGEPVFKGTIWKLSRFRQAINGDHPGIFSNRVPQWDEFSLYGKQLTKETAGFDYDLNLDAGKEIDVDVFNPPIQKRRQVELSKEQREASELKSTARPVLISGPAGCGKSIVITERIKNICEQSNYDPNLRILFTTFNKGLVGMLGLWLKDILDPLRADYKEGKITFQGSSEPNILILNFDKLPTRIGKINGIVIFEEKEKEELENAIEIVRKNKGLASEEHMDILDPHFLHDEYVRVIYGLQYDTRQKYYDGARWGRGASGVRLSRKNLQRRNLIFDAIFYYREALKEKGLHTFTSRRHDFLQKIRNGQINAQFDYLFVDEFQDCTQADFQIFYGLLKDHNKLVIAGDLAQSIHLGSSSSPPRDRDAEERGEDRLRNFDMYVLKGSYRLPFRISNCLKPLSEHIREERKPHDSDVLLPYRGAPPGARPIVVSGKEVKELGDKILDIIHSYEVYDIVDFEYPHSRKITFLEKDVPLTNHLNSRANGIATTDTILRLKGLEKECIVWSARAEFQDDEDALYYVYTIMTRTSSLLIIALVEGETPGYVPKAISLLDLDLILFWDQASREYVESLVRQINLS